MFDTEHSRPLVFLKKETLVYLVAIVALILLVGWTIKLQMKSRANKYQAEQSTKYQLLIYMNTIMALYGFGTTPWTRACVAS